MTIGIGVLCCSRSDLNEGERPDSLIMIADTMGSSEYDSTNELRKLYAQTEAGLYAVCAGNMEAAGEIVAAVVARLPELDRRTHGSFWSLLNEVVNGHRAQRFRFDVAAPRYELVPGQIQLQDHKDVIREFQDYSSGAELLIGMFDECGRAFLYDVGKVEGSSALVRPVAFPGYYAIGVGSFSALNWLNYRGQRLNFGIRRSALHIYEGCRMASSAPTVNKNTDMVIATAKRGFLLAYDRPPSADSPINLDELKRMAKKYGPKNTEAL